MLTLYNYFEIAKKEKAGDAKLDYSASDIFEILDVMETQERFLAIERTLKACMTLNIPLWQHFKKIYSYDGDDLCIDWKLSALGCYLLTVNCDPGNENVAKAQLFFFTHRS
jgi:hypothetical protein